MSVPQEVLDRIKAWDRGDVGYHIFNQSKHFTFKTWAGWVQHATEYCTLCKAVLARIDELGIEHPKDDAPIDEVIVYFREGKSSSDIDGSFRDLMDYMK